MRIRKKTFSNFGYVKLCDEICDFKYGEESKEIKTIFLHHALTKNLEFL